MARTLLGGSVLTGTLLLVSLTFNASPSVAENLAPNDSAQQTRTRQQLDPAGAKLSGQEIAKTPESAASEASAETEAAEEMNPDPSLTSRSAAEKSGAGSLSQAVPQSYTATAYALRGRTASGAPVRRGFIAADRSVLPLGSRVRLEAGSYSGEYMVADHGGAIRGRKIDIWVPSSGEAVRFGRKPVKLTVLSYGARAARNVRKAGR